MFYPLIQTIHPSLAWRARACLSSSDEMKEKKSFLSLSQSKMNEPARSDITSHLFMIIYLCIQKEEGEEKEAFSPVFMELGRTGKTVSLDSGVFLDRNKRNSKREFCCLYLFSLLSINWNFQLSNKKRTRRKKNSREMLLVNRPLFCASCASHELGDDEKAGWMST